MKNGANIVYFSNFLQHSKRSFFINYTKQIKGYRLFGIPYFAIS